MLDDFLWGRTSGNAEAADPAKAAQLQPLCNYDVATCGRSAAFILGLFCNDEAHGIIAELDG